VHWGYADKAQARQKGARNLGLLLKMAEVRPADLYLCYQTGKTLLNLRRFDEAAIWLGRGIQAGDQARLNPYLYRHAHVLLAQALDRLDRTDEAEACLKSLLDAEPGYGPAHYALGRLHYAREEYAPAAAEFTAFLGQGACDPIAGLNQDRLKYSAGLMLGRCLERTGRPHQAAAAYEVSIAADPRRPEPLLALASLCLTQGRREEASTLARKCLEVSPDHRRAQALLDEVRARE
jgi:tetratricopeptide (TPR) repeat protein